MNTKSKINKCTSLILISALQFAFLKVHACECTESLDINTQLKLSDFVFEGRIKSIYDSTIDDSIYPNYIEKIKIKVIVLKIDKIFKGLGDKQGNIRLFTPYSPEACGYEFKLNKKYIVYGSIRDNFPFTRSRIGSIYYTSICYRTRLRTKTEIRNIKQAKIGLGKDLSLGGP